MMVSTKLIPAETGMMNVKLPADKALNSTRAETKINANAPITCGFSKNCTQSLKVLKILPFSFHFISAAPETFRRAYRKQNVMAFITVCQVQ